MFRVRSTPPQREQDTLKRLLRPLKLTLAQLEPLNWIRPKRYRAIMHLYVPDQPGDRP
jgi:hypothetical protein